MLEHIIAIPQFTTVNNWLEPYELTISDNDIYIAPREVLERDKNFRQTIPYILIKNADTYLTYKRTKKNGEQRLSEKYSIGFGGHMNINDCHIVNDHIQFEGSVSKNIIRELTEELVEFDSTSFTLPPLLGYICNSSNDTDKVHVGLIYILETTITEFTTSDEGLSELAFKTKDEIAQLPNLESWSQIVLSYL